MTDKVCIFVDGENLRHSINDLFPKEFGIGDYLPKDARWTDFFDHITEIVTNNKNDRLRTYWYVIEHVDFYPYKLPKVTDNLKGLVRLLEKNPDFKAALKHKENQELTDEANKIREELIKEQNEFNKRFRGWQTIQNAITNKHDSIEFRRSGAIRYNLFKKELSNEKAVDVNLAVDMVLLKDNYDVAIIVSGDQDFVPSVQAVKNAGKKVVNVAFQRRDCRLLPGGARRLNDITDLHISVSYDDSKKYFNFE